MTSKKDIGNTIFECRQCGQCCKGFGGTYISKIDINRISEFIECDSKTFIDKFCAQSGSKFVLAQKEDAMCIFFDEKKQCTIHEVKPYMCKAWPYIATIIKNPENWNAMANSCPGMKKNVPDHILIKVVEKEKEQLDKTDK